MNRIWRIHVTIVVMLAVVINGCSNDRGASEKEGSEGSAATRGEHARDRGGDGEGEESGTEPGLDETYDDVRNGARLMLAYDAQSNSFKGSVANMTERTLARVRVEVHLSNGTEPGPTTGGDLKPGEERNVILTATGTGFDGWSAHPEVGNEEHGGHEGSGEHGGREGGGEHE